MVVQRGGSLVETPRVPRIRKPEFLEVEVMTKFVAQRAHEGSERGDLLAHRCPHPHADHPWSLDCSRRKARSTSFHALVAAALQARGHRSLELCRTVMWFPRTLCRRVGHPRFVRRPSPTRWIVQLPASARLVAGRAFFSVRFPENLRGSPCAVERP